MKTEEFDFFIPTKSNHGKSYPRKVLAQCKKLLLENFGGVTDFTHHSKGLWRSGGVEFRDDGLVGSIRPLIFRRVERGRAVFGGIGRLESLRGFN